MRRGRLGKEYGSLDPISDRVLMLAAYIAASGATVREAAKRFGVSKSTVHTVKTKGNDSCGLFKNMENNHIYIDK